VTKRLTLVDPNRKLGARCCGPETQPRLGEAAAGRLAEDLGLLAHPVRLQILDVLTRNQGQVCVCDLEESVPVKQPTVSHHLKLLREAGLIEGQKHGLWVYYRVRRTALDALRERLARGLGALTQA
jgi:ArsR family transcriptional regulator